MKTLTIIVALALSAATLAGCAPRHTDGDAPQGNGPSGQQPPGAPGGSGPVGQPQS